MPGTTDVYEFKSVAYPTMCLDIRSASTETGAFLQIFPENNKYAQQFQLVKQTNGTFGIFTGTTNYAKCLDGQYDSATSTGPYRKIKQNTCTKTALTQGQKWYFYPVEATDEHYIITQTEYTDSKNFVSATKNQRDLATYYTYDEQKGTLQNVTDTLGNKTSYAYNANNDALTSVTSGGMTNSYTYSKDRLTGINVNGATRYSFAYDTFGRTTANKVGNGTDWKTLSTISYNSAGLMSKQTYGNGNYYDFTYDNLDRIIQKRYNGDNSKRVTYSYGNTGNTAQITDYYTNTHTNFVYDLADRVVSQREYSGTGTKSTTLVSSTDFTYSDKTNYLTAVTHSSPLGTQKIKYAYGNISNGNMPDQVYIISWNGQNKISNTFDAFGRLVNKKVGAFNNTYTYYNFGTARTTTLCMSVDTPAGKYSYSYDRGDRITSYSDGTDKSTYEYDSLDQLVRENNPRTGKTYTYSYKNGNITERKEYAYTTGALGAVQATKKWTYGNTVWKDLLTNFNGEAITYDAIGNPTKIGTKTLTWNGRQLAGYVNGSNTVSYTYNGDGQRTSKTVNGTKTDYYYNGSVLAGQKTGNTTLVFMYDNNGDTFGFIYGGKEYYYVKNLQNDVTAIADSAGKVIANYYYDSWGNITSITGDTTIANINPLRYRTYYYDSETNLYYLNSRYYSPDMCRFINSDNQIANVGGNSLEYNTFAYCMNDPVNMIDPTGNWPSWSQVFDAVATVAIAAVFVAAVVASAGAVGVAAGVVAASIGATGTLVSAAITIGTVGTYVVAAGIAACALSNAGEILTGTNIIRDGLMGGNQYAYDTVQTGLSIAGGGALIIGQTNPGVTGKAAKPSPKAQPIHKVPTTSTPNTSFDKLYGGKPGNFQRTYYDYRGNMSLQIDFTAHNNPSVHSNPHLHTFWLGQRQPQINLWYLE